jgi:trehalose/maltose hydrolase-like predicted phosphorylase
VAVRIDRRENQQEMLSTADVALPKAARRRFEAVIFDWDGTAVPDRQSDATDLRQLVEALCQAGMELILVSGTHVGNIDPQLRARPPEPGHLHLCLNRGSEVFHVDEGGVRLVCRRTASPEEDAALTRAAQLTVERLGRQGLPAAIVSQRLNRRKIDLIPEPAWADPPKARLAELVAAVEERLHTHGIPSLAEVVAIASEAGKEAGLRDPRVSSDAKHVEIGLTDKSDSAHWALNELWKRGIGAGQVLIAGDEMGPLGGVPGSDSRLLVPDSARATAVSVGVEPGGVPPSVILVPGGPRAFLALLEDQLRRRLEHELPLVDRSPSWLLPVSGFDPQLERVHESLLTLADGKIGTSGAPLVRHPAASPRVLAAGVYAGQGPETELLGCPVWNQLSLPLEEGDRLERQLDLHTGILWQDLENQGRRLKAVGFSSLARPGSAVLRVEGLPPDVMPERLLPPTEDAGAIEVGEIDGQSWVRAVDGDHGVVAAAGDRRYQRGASSAYDRFAAYSADPSGLPAPQSAAEALDEIDRAGFERLLTEQRGAWADRWEAAGVHIAGERDLNLPIRFALFHLMASVGSTGEAAVGARGLTGPAYRGHVFWDSDVFVLPFLAATHPAAARAMLEYRILRLPAAIARARAEGRKGARFPWESAATGEEVSPTEARDRAGRLLAVRTGLLEEHVVADVAWAAATYADWTGDEAFLRGPGGALLVETARYWASRILIGSDARGHIRGVIGPDEYHEAVDDNAFTNVMARWNLKRAAAAVAAGTPGASPAEAQQWLQLAATISDGFDTSTQLYEQFSGFFTLEPLIIRDVAPRRPVAADLLLGRARVQEVQVLKQADVLMLHHLVPEEVVPGSLTPNLQFYEPRTAHGSSLSPGIHAALFARAGMLDEAVQALRLTARIDLDDLTGTTAGGLHLGSMGSLWQALAYGFAGLRPCGDLLCVDPRLPGQWEALTINVRFHGARVRIEICPDQLLLQADSPLRVRVQAAPAVTVGPAGLVLRRENGGWEEKA